MAGNLTIHFSELFRDTINKHGRDFAYNYYIIKNKMSINEFAHWLTVAGKI
jgi:hypothetical protein